MTRPLRQPGRWGSATGGGRVRTLVGVDRIEHLLVDLRDEVIDCLGPLEERVVALADSLARVEDHATRPLPVPMPVPMPSPPAMVDPATAALVASAASAMARVEARIEAEFAGLHRRLETLAPRIEDLGADRTREAGCASAAQPEPGPTGEPATRCGRRAARQRPGRTRPPTRAVELARADEHPASAARRSVSAQPSPSGAGAHR